MDTFIPPSTAANGATYLNERLRDFPVRPESDFYRQQQRHQQAFQHMIQEDQDDEFTLPESFYGMPTINCAQRSGSFTHSATDDRDGRACRRG